VCRFLDSATTDPSIAAVIAIGSAIRPNIVSADLDLIVIREKRPIRSASPPLEIDLHTYSASDVEAQIGSGHDLLGWAVKFGKVLFQRDRYWDRIGSSWQHRLPLPSVAVARERAVRAYQRLIGVRESGDEEAAHEQAISYLTHLARAELLAREVYPASRPELASQLRAIGSRRVADLLDDFLQNGSPQLPRIDELVKLSA
jgi:hypothetical protein